MFWNRGEEKIYTFILSWYFPNRPKMWIELDKDRTDINAGNYKVTKNYYATLFTDAWEVASYMGNERERLFHESKTFSKAFFDTTLPGYLLEAVADNITVMRSPTCFRIENGDFLGWEWVVSGDDAIVKECWPGVEKTMKYTAEMWDRDGDGVLEEPQHVTYDTELYGISSMTGSIHFQV